ncbi:MAG: ThiF family adenylyltransferase [Gammaproteobacteria bacterium]|nr:ThiF family adenylyltransferase [Gammaproteobacteria bacterium]
MDIDAWLSRFGAPTTASDLASPDATALIRFLQRYGEHVARVVEVRSAPPMELVVLDFQTGKPQQSFYLIKRCERIGICFSVHGTMPLVYMLRSDFPDTEHQQLTIEGSPRAICIDDRPWAEARLTWTPAELVHRILSWFSRAIRGELHDARQPIDPVLVGSSLSFLISRRLLAEADGRDLVGVHNTAHSQTLRIMPADGLSDEQNLEPVCVVAYRVEPERMTRMRFAPGNLWSLADLLRSRGIDLIEDLTRRLSDWLAEGAEAAWRLNARLVIVVEMPIISPHDDLGDGTDLRAYVTAKSAGDIAVALGIASSATTAQGSGVGFVRVVGQVASDEQAVRDLKIDIAETHYEFDHELATQLTGRTQIDGRRAVMIGAGAIGSHVSDCLVREGRYSWTIIDDDYLLPHNLSRHTGHGAQVTRNKAETVACDLNAVYGAEGPVAIPIAANAIFCDDTERSLIDSVLTESELIIDASASVPASNASCRIILQEDGARVSSSRRPGMRPFCLWSQPTGRALFAISKRSISR